MSSRTKRPPNPDWRTVSTTDLLDERETGYSARSMIKQTCHACNFIYLDEELPVEICPACGEQWATSHSESPPPQSPAVANESPDTSPLTLTEEFLAPPRRFTPLLLAGMAVVCGIVFWQIYEKSHYLNAVKILTRERDEARQELRDTRDRLATLAEDASGNLVELDRLRVERDSLLASHRETQTKLQSFEEMFLVLQRRNKQSFARNWMLIGPLPYIEQPNESELFLLADDLTGFHKLGDVEFTWRTFNSETDKIDFTQAFSHRDKAIGYALCWVYSDRSREVRLSIGSDDGICVWLNRVSVHRNLTNRSGSPGQDKIDVTLKAAWNEILCRIDNRGSGDWNMYLEFQTPNDARPLRLFSTAQPPSADFVP